MHRILRLVVEHVDAALDDHPPGATDEILAQFAVDRLGDCEDLSDEEWALACSPAFRDAVLAIVRSRLVRAEEGADR